ncbi:(2,3-dihydroxybenzoyl)adenylate synthase [Nocardiopsis sp. LOL_012]|uniref:(2,3-dihydroxybenzoyl)adenylate synthase n=1 Tax=Nocardiopsis sp. LOL_012 TaxID=3345409 RepID=UPI003A84219F
MSPDWPRLPDEDLRSYRDQGFRDDRPLSLLLREQAAARSGATALVSRSGRLTYAELDARVDRLAHGLSGLPVRAGERVLVRLPNREEYVVTLFALLRIGAVPVLALPSLGPAEAESLAETSGACALVVADRYGRTDPREEAARIAERLPCVRHVLVAGDPGEAPARSLASLDPGMAPRREEAAHPEDLALLLLSGGTTGTPKLIPRTHADYGYNARASAQACGAGPDTVYLAVLPVAHNFTMVSPGIVGVLAAGGTVVLCPDPSPTTAFPLIARERVALTSLVPALVPSWLEEAGRTREDLSSLRTLQVGGARLDEGTARRIGPELGCRLQQVFGMAEGLNSYTALDAPEETVCTTQGRPLSPADEVLVVDEGGEPVPPGTAGELLTRGPYTLRGYYRARELDALRFTPDGFYRTGDLVVRSPEGDLVVVGRIKDQVNRAGEKIAAVEVEEHLLSLPGVRSAAVVGVPDPHLGERSVAFLTAKGPVPSREEVRAALLQRGAAPFKVPDEVRAVPALPLTGAGKVDKRRLRETSTG